MASNIVKWALEFTAKTASIDKAAKKIGGLKGEIESVGRAFDKIGKFGMGFMGVVGTIRTISGKMQEFTDAYNAQIEAETKLAQVMRNTMGARAGEIEGIKALAAAQQRLGVIGDEVQLAGAQELGTYLSKTETLKKLMPVMNDMLAQQYGLNATQEQAATIASMLGKVMDGQVGALSRYGYKFDEAQEKILKFGTEEQRAATLAKVVGDAVGGMNRRLALTNAGRAKQLANNVGDLKEQVGGLTTLLAGRFVPTASKVVSKLQAMVEVPLPEQLAREKAELNNLVESLIEATGREDERKRLIDEIQAKYPDFLKNIDLEKSSTEELRDALKEANAEYDKRMRKAALERRLTELDEKSAGVMDDILAYQLAINAKQERDRLYHQVNDKLAAYGRANGKKYGYSWDQDKIYYWGGSIGKTQIFDPKELGLDAGQVEEVKALAAEYRAQGKFATVWGHDERRLKEAQARYDLYRLQRRAIVDIVNRDFGIDPVALPGEGGGGGTDGEDPLNQKAQKASETIVTGGTRNTQITINLGKMVESIVFNGGLQENLAAMQQQVEEALLRTLYAAQSAAV